MAQDDLTPTRAENTEAMTDTEILRRNKQTLESIQDSVQTIEEFMKNRIDQEVNILKAVFTIWERFCAYDETFSRVNIEEDKVGEHLDDVRNKAKRFRAYFEDQLRSMGVEIKSYRVGDILDESEIDSGCVEIVNTEELTPDHEMNEVAAALSRNAYTYNGSVIKEQKLVIYR